MNSDQEAFQSRGCCHVPTTYQKDEHTNQHSCCKLDAYDWLADINFVEDKRYFDIVEVRFKNNRKDFFRSPEGEIYRRGDIVAVESSPGHDIGIVSLSGEIVRLQMKKKHADPKNPYIKKVYRKARTSDIEKWTQAAALEIPSMIQTRRIVNELGLEMKINDVEFQGDKTKAIFYYTADGRVDFRELIKLLAEKFSVRIEMKQIGVRQESSRLGGIGSCGRELCCSSWLTDFKSVSTTTARTQQLSMNPQKLAGQCGKLKCCLNFEHDNYKEELRKFPSTQKRLRTKSGEAFFQKMDILSGMMWYSYVDNPSLFIPVKREDVIKIQQLNEKGELPEVLDEYTEIVSEEIKFDNVIGQDDLTRFDKKEKTYGKRNSNNRSGRNKNRKGNNRGEKLKGNYNKPRKASASAENKNKNTNSEAKSTAKSRTNKGNQSLNKHNPKPNGNRRSNTQKRKRPGGNGQDKGGNSQLKK